MRGQNVCPGHALGRRAKQLGNIALVFLALTGCASTEPIVRLIAGQAFDVVSVDGRPFPTTVMVNARGSCAQLPVKRITLAFKSNGDFLVTHVGPNDTMSLLDGSFVETSPGVQAIINDTDTATFAHGLLRVNSTWNTCGVATLIAHAM